MMVTLEDGIWETTIGFNLFPLIKIYYNMECVMNGMERCVFLKKIYVF
jgi:hypothetical protein